jgi:hypothetical protein
MAYETPKVFDLGQVTEHVFQVSPPDDGQDPEAGAGQGGQSIAPAAGSSGGLAGLGLIGGLFAALGGRSSSQPVIDKPKSPDGEPDLNRANSR